MGGEVTAKADLYSLGAMIYEMVTGRPTFVGDDAVAIIGQHLNTPPVAHTWHRPDCPPALEGLVLRLLEKDLAKRPASAAEVVRGLENLTPIPFPAGDSREGVKKGATAIQPPPSSEAAGRWQGVGSPLYRRAFVGREAELKQLREAFDAAMSGQGGLMTVVGEPGIGKTALIEQVSTYAALRGGKALVGHCYEEGSLTLPYLAFVEAIRSYVLERDPDALRKELGAGAADVARIVSEVRDRVRVELRPAGDPEDDRYRLLQAVSGFLSSASGVQPLLVVLEDLHWADKGTIELLVHMARNLRGARLLIIGTYRDVEVDRAHPLSGTIAELRRIGTFARVPLRGLTPDEVHRMVQAITGESTPYALAEAIHRQTEGNPLFIQEVLRYLVEEGRLGKHLLPSSEAAGKGAGGIGGFAIPEGLLNVVGKRLSRLSETCSRALTVAAVIGRDFRLDVLQKVAGLSDEELAKALEEARGTAVIEETRMGGICGVSYRFTHAFFRQTLYEEIIAPRRIRLHQQVARALEDVHRRRLDEHAAELAEHFSYSSDPEDLARAVQYGEAAARRAMAVYAYGEAVRHLERCLQVQEVLDPDDKAKRCDLLLALGEALTPAGQAKRASEFAAEGAFRLAAELHDAARGSKASLIGIDAISRALAGAGAIAQHLAWCQRLERLAGPKSPARVIVDVEMGRRANNAGRHAEALELIRRGYRLARELQDAPLTVMAGRNILLTLNVPGEHRERAALAEELLTVPREGAATRHLAVLFGLSIGSFLAVGEREKAQNALRLLQALEPRKDPTGTMYIQGYSVVIQMLDGRLSDIADRWEEAYTTWKEMGELGFIAAENWPRALLLLGRPEDALRLSGPPPFNNGPFQANRLAGAGRLGEARKPLLDALANPRDFGVPGLCFLLEAAVACAERQAAERLVASLRPSESAAVAGPVAAKCPARILGEASAFLGDHAQARKDFELALELSTKIRNRPETALTRLGLGELLLDHFPSMRAEALQHLDAAVAEFRDMKMQPSLERALKRKEILKA